MILLEEVNYFHSLFAFWLLCWNSSWIDVETILLPGEADFHRAGTQLVDCFYGKKSLLCNQSICFVNR